MQPDAVPTNHFLLQQEHSYIFLYLRKFLFQSQYNMAPCVCKQHILVDPPQCICVGVYMYTDSGNYSNSTYDRVPFFRFPWMNSNSLSMRCPTCLVFPLLTESYFQTYFRFGIGFLGALFIFFGGYSNVELCYSLTRELVDINSDPRGNYAQLLYRVNHNKVKGQQYADWKMFLKRNCSV